jgi:phenylpropionate dioxygenase-like ring-hydroxylating dioxygenase large terminal subunit
MFVHKEQLEYALRPEDYSAPEVHRAEVDRCFLRAWHPVCLAGDLPRVGDFLTTELAGRPLLLRRTPDGLRAYLNICSHRHCLLTDAARGHAPGIACQYHGWEYGVDGRVSKVPDGGCFKPFDRENARLDTFSVATCGELVFVRLAAEGPSLAEHLGEWFDRVATSFAAPYACNWRYAADFPCNWKIPVENTVETYHLPSVHPTTLGGFGMIPEEAQKHYLENRSTTLEFDMGRDTPLMQRRRHRHRRLRPPPRVSEPRLHLLRSLHLLPGLPADRPRDEPHAGLDVQPRRHEAKSLRPRDGPARGPAWRRGQHRDPAGGRQRVRGGAAGPRRHALQGLPGHPRGADLVLPPVPGGPPRPIVGAAQFRALLPSVAQ